MILDHRLRCHAESDEFFLALDRFSPQCKIEWNLVDMLRYLKQTNFLVE